MRIKYALAVTHAGRKKKVNEDGILQIPTVPLYAVVDGTGGPEAAEAATSVLRANARSLQGHIQKVAADPTSSTRLSVGRFFDTVFHKANASLKQVAEKAPHARFASTMVVATFVDRFAYLAHVGNSRAYLKRDDELWILTTDHTVAMEALTRGDLTQEEYEASPFKKTLTQALGISSRLEVEFAEVWLSPGDILLLCSDGLTRVVDDQTICELIHGADLKKAAKDLVMASLSAGGPDNVTVVLIEIGAADDEEIVKANVAETLRMVFLFRELTEPDRMTIAPYLEEIIYGPGDRIITEGEDGDSFYVVISGKVRVTKGETHLTDIGPGGQFGELALVGSGRRSASVTALDRTRLFQLSRERFMQIIRSKPNMAARMLLPLLTRVSDRLTDVTDRLARLESQSAG